MTRVSPARSLLTIMARTTQILAASLGSYMAWQKTPADRARDRAVYEDPEYKRNRAIVLRQANGRCTRCGKRTHLQCDHILNVAAGGTHALSNLQALCDTCHQHKTAREGGRRTAQPHSDPSPRPATRW